MGGPSSPSLSSSSRPLPSLPMDTTRRQSSSISFAGRHPLLAAPQLSERTSSDLTDASSLRAPRQPRLSSRFQPPPSLTSSFSSGTTRFLLSLGIPGVLASILVSLEWIDAYHLFASCKQLFEESFARLELKDVVLSRYVPGYAHCLRARDMQFYQDIPITVFDLNRLLLSQRVPLHRYPIHALKTLQAWLPTLEDDAHLQKFAALTQAHSRFVLLLQSLVHSSNNSSSTSSSSSSSPADDFAYLHQHQRSSRFSPIQTLRELTFPAPLSYIEPSRPPHLDNSAKLVKHARHKSAPPATTTTTNATSTHPASPLKKKDTRPSTRSISDAWSPKLRSGPHSSADPSLHAQHQLPASETPPQRKQRKLSIFGKRRPATPPPPPPALEASRALKMYSSTWRKSAMYPGAFMLDFASTFDDTGSAANSRNNTLKRFQGSSSPGRRASKMGLVGAYGGSSNGSSVSSTLSTSRSRGSLYVPPGALTPPRPGTAAGSGAGASTPHDLILATSRSLAPVLRVFVPCTSLEKDSDSVAACEQQLVESGLWDHLSTGDIVCNLGYVPPIDDGSEDTFSEGREGTSRPSTGSRRSSSGLVPTSSQNNSAKWLLFNGHVLLPYTPPALLPLSQPLNLPSPFYYNHLLPPNSSTSNTSFMIERFPVCDDVPQFTLVQSSRRVKSPHSAGGCALVKSFSWTARVFRVKPEGMVAGTDAVEMGEGWYGEWVLEGEGTEEGKGVLVDALRGADLGKREWELVKEKSGPGRIWLRLLTM